MRLVTRISFLAPLFSIVLLLGLMVLSVARTARALPSSPLLSDVNGDGKFELLTFGDSITVGLGDTPSDRGGYPARLQSILQVPVINNSRSGEALAQRGLNRFKMVTRLTPADTIILNEGNSDAYIPSISIGQYRSALVNAVTYVRTLHRNLVLATQYPTDFELRLSERRLEQVNFEIKDVAKRNGLHVIDIDRAWRTTCNRLPNCDLLYSDGLHPNHIGYDVITGVALGVLAKIDVFLKGGAARIDAAYGLPKGYVIVKPGGES